MTTQPAAPAASPDTAVDQVLADRCQSSGDYLAGLIAHGMLEAASRPGKLPELLFPDGNPALVRAVWEAALAVRPTWTPDALYRLRAALDTAGYVAMGRMAARSASVQPPLRPADTEVPVVGPAVRGGGHL